MNTKSLKLILLTSMSLFLSACGGGSSSISNEQADNGNDNSEPPITNPQPTAISADNWASARLIQSENPMQTSVEVVGSELIVNIESADISQGAHLQIYLNTDNKPETGFQFENEAWEESGVDYLIEDGDLFKSTQNNTGWNWNVNVGAIDYTINTDTANAKIDLSLLGNICNNLTVGVMTRDEFWDISTFSPASSKMQQFTVSYCNTVELDTVKPEISLLGANPLNINVNGIFVDPGATAVDNIDGDITSRIIPKSTVNVALSGTYEVSYLVTDIAGNSAAITRTVIINDVAPPEGIVVDGDTSDWNDISTHASSASAIMKVSDDEEKLYILITSSNLGENTQILMDTDNNSLTGLKLSAQVSAWLGGADYMIENLSLDKSKSNTGWSWDYGIAPIEYLKTVDTLEIAIKKSDINSLANDIPMGYVSRTAEWNTNYTLPVSSLPIYTLKFPVAVNPVIANNDSATTFNNEAVVVDVRSNDIALNNSALKIFQITQPESGIATIVQNKVKYTPDPTFTGAVNFTYVITDSLGNRDTASIKIIVTTPPNIAPIGNNDFSTIDFDSPVIVKVLSNDTDADGDSLNITSITQPTNGTTVINGDSIKYSPNDGFSGTDTFSYSISDDNGGTASATVTIVVNERVYPVPIANNDNMSTLESQSAIIDALANDTAIDDDITLTIIKTSTASNGNIEIINNKIKYSPVSQFSGTDTFTYTISNGFGGEATATINVSVSALPNNPPIAKDDSRTTNGIKTKKIAVLVNDTDIDGDTLQIVGFTSPTNGSLTLSTSTATFNYTPNATFSGIDTFTYTISDGQEGNDTATVTITVPTNNAPDAVEDVADVDFNKTITINVLNNDTDPDGDVLSVQSIVQPTVGVATLNANGTIFFDPQNNIGSISIGYTVSDSRGGTDFAILTVASTDPNDGNDAYPDITNEYVTTPKNTAIFIDVLLNDTDADGDVLILDQVDQGQNGTTIKVNGGVRYTPNAGFVGTDIFYYGVHDGHGHNGAGFVEVTVTQ